MLKRLSDDNIFWSFHMILHEGVYVHLTYPRCSSLFQRNIQRTNLFKISHSSWGLPRSTLRRKNTKVSSVLCVSFQKIIKFIKDYKICRSIDCLRSCTMSAVFQLSKREIMLDFSSLDNWSKVFLLTWSQSIRGVFREPPGDVVWYSQ